MNVVAWVLAGSDMIKKLFIDVHQVRLNKHSFPNYHSHFLFYSCVFLRESPHCNVM